MFNGHTIPDQVALRCHRRAADPGFRWGTAEAAFRAFLEAGARRSAPPGADRYRLLSRVGATYGFMVEYFRGLGRPVDGIEQSEFARSRAAVDQGADCDGR